LASALSLAVLARPGTPATSDRPSVLARYDTGCLFQSSFTPLCNSLPLGSNRSLSLEVFLHGGNPGTVTFDDDCIGQQQIGTFPDEFAITVPFTTPALGAGRICTATIRVATLEGAATQVTAQYQLF
jgi:hypothetical protein